MALINSHDITHPIIAARIRVIAGPFESTIGKMQQMGWRFEVAENTYRGTVNLRGVNPLGMAFGTEIPYDNVQHLPFIYVTHEAVLAVDIARRVEMPVMQYEAAEVGDQVRSAYDMDFVIYEYGMVAGNQPKEIIAEPKTVQELLKEIESLQQPRAKEILAEQRKREGMEQIHLEAKILSFK